VIPRLWVCTSHPWLQVLAAPLHPVAILGLMVAAWLAAEPSAYWQSIAVRLKRLWQGLLMASAGGFALIAIPGWVVSKLGANPNSIFVAARYIWVVLAWAAVALSIAWGARGAAAIEASDDGSGRPRALAGAPGCLALFAFVIVGARLFISDPRSPLAIPYSIADFFFDATTMDLASDECLAFRSVDDVAVFEPWSPGWTAAATLVRHGESAVPGIASYLDDGISRPDSLGGPRGVSVWLLAFLAQYGDHPMLQKFERYDGFEASRMRQCLHSRRHVVLSPSRAWQCNP
jgi:hypothetical protein